jgi:uncharacterized membrane protein
MVGVAPDISRYDEPKIGTGMDGQIQFYKNGNFVNEYFKNEVVPLTKVQMREKFPQDPRDLETNGKFNYNFLGHVIPAVGSWLGYHISPTLGMMVTVGRLFSMFIYSLMMAVIIKFLRRGKLLFTVVSLSPVMLNSFSSFSYDSLGYVLVAAVTMLCINSIASKRVSKLNLLGMIVLIPLLLVGSKPNLFPVLLMIPLVLIYCQGKKASRRRAMRGVLAKSGVRQMSVRNMRLLGLAAVIGLAGLVVVLILTASQGGLLDVLKRMLFTFDFRYYLNSSVGDSINLLASPYPAYNYTPTWMLGVWFALLIFVLVYERNYHDSNLISLGSLFLLVVGILGPYYYQLNYGDILDNIGYQNTIQGVQWRYHTPLLLLLSPVLANSRWNIKMQAMRQGVVLSIIGIISFVSTLMLVFNTIYGMINL